MVKETLALFLSLVLSACTAPSSMDPAPQGVTVDTKKNEDKGTDRAEDERDDDEREDGEREDEEAGEGGGPCHKATPADEECKARCLEHCGEDCKARCEERCRQGRRQKGCDEGGDEPLTDCEDAEDSCSEDPLQEGDSCEDASLTEGQDTGVAPEDTGLTPTWSAPLDCHGDTTLGTWGYCTETCPCAYGEGDCDSDTACMDGLVCAADVGGAWGYDAWIDVCQETCHKGDAGGYGYCTEACPCDAGGGDCNVDAECADGLVCAPDVGADYGYDAWIDVCQYTCHRGSPGDYGFCTAACPCQTGEGDCNSDAECAEGLVCAPDVGADHGYDAWIDVCQATCHGGSNGDHRYCSELCPCDHAEGDCDSDAECTDGLTCVADVGYDYGWDPWIDVCETR